MSQEHQKRTPEQQEAAAWLAEARKVRMEPKSAEQLAAEKIANEKMRLIRRQIEIGEEMLDGSIYIGTRVLKDRNESIVGTFNLFASPFDLCDETCRKTTFEYEDTVRRVAELKGWVKFDGCSYENDTEFYNALRNGTYNGGWVIPTEDILKEDIYKNMEKGRLKGTFNTDEGDLRITPAGEIIVTGDGNNLPNKYWTSTIDLEYQSVVCTVEMPYGNVSWWPRTEHKLSCRPVRLTRV